MMFVGKPKTAEGGFLCIKCFPNLEVEQRRRRGDEEEKDRDMEEIKEDEKQKAPGMCEKLCEKAPGMCQKMCGKGCIDDKNGLRGWCLDHIGFQMCLDPGHHSYVLKANETCPERTVRLFVHLIQFILVLGAVWVPTAPVAFIWGCIWTPQHVMLTYDHDAAKTWIQAQCHVIDRPKTVITRTDEYGAEQVDGYKVCNIARKCCKPLLICLSPVYPSPPTKVQMHAYMTDNANSVVNVTAPSPHSCPVSQL